MPTSAALTPLHLYRPMVSAVAAGDSDSNDLSNLAMFFRQVNWKATLEGTEAARNVADDLVSISGRVAGLKAFRRKYYRLIFDEVGNGARGLTGIVVSKRWRAYHTTLKKIGEPLSHVAAALNLVDLGVKMHELEWDDLSARGVASNVSAGLAQWASESVALGPAKTMRTVSEWVGDGVGRLGYQETARDIQQFSRDLESTINSAQSVIDRIMSAANARDVLTWDRSVLNQNNWQPVFEEASAGLHELGKKTIRLFNAVVDAHTSGGVDGAW